METAKLETMVKGWFVGNFEPSLFKTDACEVGVKHYKAGESEALHHHRVAAASACAARNGGRATSSSFNLAMPLPSRRSLTPATSS